MEDNVRKVGQTICYHGSTSTDWRKGVSVIDDDRAMCAFIRDVLDECDDLRCVGTYDCAEQALEMIPYETPQLVLVDIKLPGMSGLECIQRLKQAMPGLQIVVVTGLHGRNMIREASVAGCDAYIEKPFSTHQLLATLRFTLLQQAIDGAEQAPFREETRKPVDFSSREREVMVRLSKGLLYKEIASELGISFSLVHKLQNRMFHKLQARNRTEAVSKWERMNRTPGSSSFSLQ